jgi:pimeloyl-ACP methyl ester carboxylesterase
MPYADLGGVRLHYEELGEGQPVIFLHGLWASGRFFGKQLPYFGEGYRAIALDFRAHGGSDQTQRGHTVSTYARDLRAFMEALGIEDAVVVGWSMGAFVVWEYVRQFGTERMKAAVFVNATASDLNKDDWSYGFIDFEGLVGLMQAVQTDRPALVRGTMIPAMLSGEPSAEDAAWMTEEIVRMPEAIAGAICFDQMVADFRDVLGSVGVPSLVCFGRGDKLLPFEGAEHLRDSLPDARLVAFDNSGHMPFLEEADRFNAEVDGFLRSLDGTSRKAAAVGIGKGKRP